MTPLAALRSGRLSLRTLSLVILLAMPLTALPTAAAACDPYSIPVDPQPCIDDTSARVDHLVASASDTTPEEAEDRAVSALEGGCPNYSIQTRPFMELVGEDTYEQVPVESLDHQVGGIEEDMKEFEIWCEQQVSRVDENFIFQG